MLPMYEVDLIETSNEKMFI